MPEKETEASVNGEKEAGTVQQQNPRRRRWFSSEPKSEVGVGKEKKGDENSATEPASASGVSLQNSHPVIPSGSGSGSDSGSGPVFTPASNASSVSASPSNSYPRASSTSPWRPRLWFTRNNSETNTVANRPKGSSNRHSSQAVVNGGDTQEAAAAFWEKEREKEQEWRRERELEREREREKELEETEERARWRGLVPGLDEGVESKWTLSDDVQMVLS